MLRASALTSPLRYLAESFMNLSNSIITQCLLLTFISSIGDVRLWPML